MEKKKKKDVEENKVVKVRLPLDEKQKMPDNLFKDLEFKAHLVRVDRRSEENSLEKDYYKYAQLVNTVLAPYYIKLLDTDSSIREMAIAKLLVNLVNMASYYELEGMSILNLASEIYRFRYLGKYIK